MLEFIKRLINWIIKLFKKPTTTNSIINNDLKDASGVYIDD
jgi:hypothetical protein